MLSSRSGIVLGYHGCDHSVAEQIIQQQSILKPSENAYDWLGHGIYFWENSPARALDYATVLKHNPSRSNSPIKNPSVIGAVISLGNCLDLLDYGMKATLRESYETLEEHFTSLGGAMPINRRVKNFPDLMLRELDCAVIQLVHQIRHDLKAPPFDSVRCAFQEGDELYPGAGFREKDHIQICVRNPNCIQGFFWPRPHSEAYPRIW